MTLRPHPDVRVLSSQRLHAGRVFDVVREQLALPSGLRQEIDVVVHAGAVAIAALDDDGSLVLVRQYRHAIGDWICEVPAGRVEPGEDRLAAAMRELEEETGLRAAAWELLAEFAPAPGFCSEIIALYLARGLTAAGADARAADHDEELAVERRRPADLFAARHPDAKTLIAAALVLERVT